jgi:hypothetical protein
MTKIKMKPNFELTVHFVRGLYYYLQGNSIYSVHWGKAYAMLYPQLKRSNIIVFPQPSGYNDWEFLSDVTQF